MVGEDMSHYNGKKTDCYFFHEVQDFNATIPECARVYDYECPCETCEDYLSRNLVEDFIEQNTDFIRCWSECKKAKNETWRVMFNGASECASSGMAQTNH